MQGRPKNIENIKLTVKYRQMGLSETEIVKLLPPTLTGKTPHKRVVTRYLKYAREMGLIAKKRPDKLSPIKSQKAFDTSRQ